VSQPTRDFGRRGNRSSFLAAFLSAIFPGLGQAYSGAWGRAIGFVAAPVLLVALLAGLVLHANHLELLGLLLDPTVLSLILIVNVGLLVYRAVAVIDAWRTSNRLNELDGSDAGPSGGTGTGLRLASMAGLLAVLLVMSGVHVAVAYYDLQAQQLACIFDAVANTCASGADASAASPSGAASPPSGPFTSPGARDASTAAPGVTSAPAATIAPWTGGRLNILLIGSDQRPPDPTFNTDTMIVVSIDPATKQVAMFSLPRDTVNVPVPPGFARGAFGSTYSLKINSLWTRAYDRPDLFPGSDLQRGFNALKEELGYLYGIQINYYVEVNFAGFQEVVDTLGGVTINVQMPVVDDNFPGDNPGDRGIPERVYIPAGLQHMTGEEALVYARSRHGSNDFDRAARQQRVIVSLRNQTNIASVIPRLPALIRSLRDTVHTDIPISALPGLLALAGSVDTTNIRAYVFAPPLYETEYLNDPFGLGRGYITVPDVARIRAAVAGAFTVDPNVEALREKISQEHPSVWVLDGNGDPTEASNLAADLAYEGMSASAPLVAPKAPTRVTKIQVFNGAQDRLPATLARLVQLLGVRPVFVADHSVHVDIIITTSGRTPSLAPPPAP